MNIHGLILKLNFYSITVNSHHNFFSCIVQRVKNYNKKEGKIRKHLICRKIIIKIIQIYILRGFYKKSMIICFIYLTKIFFSAKAILEFFQLFYSNFNLVHYARKKLYICDDNLLQFCRNSTLKWVQEH